MSTTATLPLASGATAASPHATCCSPTVPHLESSDTPVPSSHNRVAVAGPVSITSPVVASSTHASSSRPISHSHSQSPSSSNTHHALNLATGSQAHRPSTNNAIRHSRERPPPLQLHSMDGATTPRHDLSASSSPSTTPAKRAGSDSERETSVKRRSPPHPATGSERASASPSGPAAASTSASGPSTNVHQVTASMSHTHGNATNSTSQAHYSNANSHSNSHQHHQTRPHQRSHITVGAVASDGPFGGLVDASSLVAPHQTWRRRHSVASPLNLISESPSTTWSGSPIQQQQQSSFRLSSQLPRSGTNPQGSSATHQATREGGTVARSPAAPRGLDDEAIYSDLSVLGFPMPQTRPDQRAPERLADRIEEWGMLSELGPVSRRELFSVRGREHRASGGMADQLANQQVADAHGQETQDLDAQDAQGEEDAQSPEPDAPAATHVTAQAVRTEVPEAPQAADPLLARPSLQYIDMGLRALEQQLQQFQQRSRLSQGEQLGQRQNLPNAQSDDVPAAEASSAANGLRPLLLGRPAGRSTAVVSGGPTLDGDMAARLHAISEMRRRLREAAAEGAAAAAQTAPAAQAAPATAPSATTTNTSRLQPPNLGTPVPQRDRNNAVRNWRNGVAQHAPVEGGAWSADPYVTRQSERALAAIRERLRTQIAVDPVPINGRPSDRVTPMPVLPADADRGAGSSAPRSELNPLGGGDWLGLLHREPMRDRERPQAQGEPTTSGRANAVPPATATGTPTRVPATDSNLSIFPYEAPASTANAPAAAARASAREEPSATTPLRTRPRDSHNWVNPHRPWNEVLPIDTSDNFDPSVGVDPLGTPRHALDFESLLARRATQSRQRQRERERERDHEREPDIAGAPLRTRPYSSARQSLYRASPGWRWEDPEQVYGAFATQAGIIGQNEAREAPPLTATSPAADRFDRTTHLPSLLRSARAATGEMPSANGTNRQHIRPESLLTRTAAAESVRLADARRARRLAEAQSSAARVHEAIARLSTSGPVAADGGDPVDLDPIRRSWTGISPFASTSSTLHNRSAGEPDLTTSAELHSRLQLARLSRSMRSLQDETEANDTPARRLVAASLLAAHNAHEAARAMARTEDDDRMMHLVLGSLTRYTHNMGPEAMTLDNLLLGGHNPPSRSHLKLHSGLQPAERTKVLMAVARGLSRMPLHVRRRATQSVLTKSPWDSVKLEGDKDECCAICQDDVSAPQPAPFPFPRYPSLLLVSFPPHLNFSSSTPDPADSSTRPTPVSA